MKLTGQFYTYIFIIAVVFSACSSEQQFPQRRSPEERAKQLKAQLDLTDEQTAAIEKIYRDMDKKMADLREQAGGDREAMRENFRALREETDQAIEEVLFEDQIEQYREYNEQRRENMRRRRSESEREN